MNVRYLISLLIGYALSCTSVYADCQTPQYTNTYAITHQSAALSWSYYGNNSPSYQLQWRVSGSATWTTNSVQTVTYTTLTGLANNTTYEWRIRSICAAGDTSAYMNATAFQTTCDQPASLNTTTITHQSAQLIWYTSASGATYEVQWRPVGAAEWIVVSGLAVNSLTLTGLSEETSFEWKVRTICSATATSDFSIGPFFRTRCLPPSTVRVTLTNPEAVEFKWDSPVDNVLFDLQWRQAGTATWTLVEGITAAEYILTGLTNTTSYEWQVRTSCSVVSKSGFSDVQSVQTNCPISTNLTTSNVRYSSAIIQWSSFAVDLQWRAAGATDWTTVSNPKSPYTLTDLTNNTMYEWRVRTVCSPTVASAYTTTQLFTTQCTAPNSAYSYSDNAGGFYLTWSSLDVGPFEVQWRVAGSGSWSVATGISGTTYDLTGLLPATTYEWRVRSLCSPTEYSGFATAQPITTPCSIPTSLRNENVGNATIDLVWNSAEPGGRYEVQWRVSNTPDWTTLSDIVVTRYTLTSLQSAVSYEWRVRKLCSPGAASAFADSQTFTYNCAQPTTFSTTGINFSSATVSWSGVTTYAPYELQYRQTGINDWTSVTSLTTTTYSVSGLSNTTSYEWRVRSSCPSGGSTDFSAVQTFQTECNSQFLSVGAGNVDYSSAGLYWQDYGNSSLYEIQYREVGNANWVVLRPEGTETDYNFGRSTTYYNFKQYTLYNLTPATTYEWRIRRLCTASIYSDFVNGQPFTTTCILPTGFSSYQETNTSLSINWSAPQFITSYDLQWRMVGASTWTTVTGLTSKAYTVRNLTPGGSYEYRVRRQCSPGIVSEFSVPLTVTLQCDRPIGLAREVLSASSIRLTWTYRYDNSDVTSLSNELQYRVLGTSDWTTLTGITGTTYSLTGVSTGVIYEWRVRTVCSPGITSDFSDAATFQLTCEVPSITSYYTEVGPSSALLSWNNYSTSSHAYLIQWRVVGSANWSTISVPASSNTPVYSLTGLTNNTGYEWRVATNCVAGFLSDFSRTQSFQTSCQTVQNLTTNSVGATSAQLSWSGANLYGQSSYTLQYRIRGTVIWTEISSITSPAMQLMGLAVNTGYEWRVRVECEAGVATKFSYNSVFSTHCPDADGLYVYSLSTQSALLGWFHYAETIVVNLQWRLAYSNNAWNDVPGLTNSTYLLAGLAPATTYEYRLQSVCAVTSPTITPIWSNRFFTTLSENTSPLAIYPDSVLAQSVRLDWLTSPNKKNYVLQWRVRNESWHTTGPLSAKMYLLTGLTPNTTYDVRLSYVENNATYEATTTFTTSCAKATNLSTADIKATSARLTWIPMDTPVAVQWRLAGAAVWTTVSDITGNSYTLTGLTNNVLYEWRILTRCSADVTNATYPVAFQTICQMPVSVSTQKVTTESALLSWSGVNTTYSVQYRAVGTSAWTVVTGLTSTTYALTGLTNNKSYEWSVTGVCTPGINTEYTTPLLFKTQCKLPTSLNASVLTASQALLQWDGPESAYELQWRVIGSIAWSAAPVVTSPYTLTGLSTGATYEWRIRATCTAAANGPFAAGNTFILQCPAYYLYKNTPYITASMAILTWVANSALIYRLRWRLVGSSTWTDVVGNVTTPYTLTGLTTNTAYEWQLLTDCPPGDDVSQFFQTHCNSPISLRTDDITTTSARLRWNDSKDGLGYEVQWRVAGTSTWTSISGITSTSCLLSGLANYTDYEWQVRSQCSNEATFQLTTQFKTINECPLGMYTVRSGSWDDPAVWSCNRLPTSTDQVQLKHILSLPNSYTGKALYIRYETGATLTLGIGASLSLSQ